MARRVGTYTNPSTGETDWLEPDTAHMLVLKPQMVTRVGHSTETPIDFKIGNIDEEEVITLVAEYDTTDGKIRSTAVKMNEVLFADQFAALTYADRAIDDAECVIAAKVAAVADLTKRLMDNGILTGGMSFTGGIGFAIVEEEKIATVEELDFLYTVTGGKGVRTITIRNCVTQASLKNIPGFRVVYYTGTHRIEAVGPVVTESIEGRLKTYTMTVEDFIVTADANPTAVEIFANPRFDNDDFLDRFIASRKTLIDDGSARDRELDDRMDDLF